MTTGTLILIIVLILLLGGGGGYYLGPWRSGQANHLVGVIVTVLVIVVLLRLLGIY